MLFFLAARRRHARLRASWLFMAVLHRAEDLLLAAVWGFFGSLSVERASRLGFRILSKIGPRLRKSRHVRTNLGMARPELSDAELDALVAETWGNYGSALAEYPHLERICVSEADERLEVVGIEHVRPVAEAGEPLLFVPAHLANWEVPAALVHRAGFPLTVVHSPLRNPLVAARMERARQPSGCEFLSKGEGVRAVIERLRKRRMVAILPDVRIDSGVQVRMFGEEVPTTLVPARLAIREGCALVPVRIERLPGVRFRITIYPLLRPDESIEDSKEQALEMTQRLNDHYSEWIQARPSDWLCVKRRKPKESKARLRRLRAESDSE
jgi:KDO2-lipid IV(A) lauroyltransferase